MNDQDIDMTPTRPYLIRAMYEWIEDNKLTAYLAVDVTFDGVMVPMEHVKDGQIVLNMASIATHKMLIANDAISFSARFGGVSRNLYIPMQAVLGIYAKQNGQGMFFDPQEYVDVDLDTLANDTSPEKDTPSTEVKEKEARDKEARIEKAKKSGFRVIE